MATDSAPLAPSKPRGGLAITDDENFPPHDELGAPDVPAGLSVDEARVYGNLIKVASVRGNTGQSPPEVIVIVSRSIALILSLPFCIILRVLIPKTCLATRTGLQTPFISHQAVLTIRTLQTDLAKDYDDLSAMIVLKELHRLGLSK